VTETTEFRPVPSDLGEHELLVNMGPSHPSTHGVLRVVLRVDGEKIVGTEPDVGFLHRCFEKMCEGWTYPQIVPLTDRTDYLSPMTCELAYVTAVEKMAGIEVPERAHWLRVIMAELQRIASHLVWFGSLGNDLGATSPFIYALREREHVMDLFEAVSGARLTYSYMRLGGVRQDLVSGFADKARAFLKLMPGRIREYENLFMKNAIFLARSKGVGKFSARQAIAYGASGPVLRASGVDFDLRRDEPYAAYARFKFDVPLGENGDVYDRAVCRFGELRASLDIIGQALDGLPEGDVLVKVPKVLKLPEGDAYSRVESPRGEVGLYIVSDGGTSPYRLKWRAPSFVHLESLALMCDGYMVADVVANIAALDIVLGEVDR
jgi:NADH-quinone oxidoreductase subunit D